MYFLLAANVSNQEQRTPSLHAGDASSADFQRRTLESQSPDR
jgi:hypothetical protein